MAIHTVVNQTSIHKRHRFGKTHQLSEYLDTQRDNLSRSWDVPQDQVFLISVIRDPDNRPWFSKVLRPTPEVVQYTVIWEVEK
jgi:hypothetical protein